MKTITSIQGCVTAPRGYSACGVHAGIKENGLDLALIVSEQPAILAGTFTTNRIQGPTVKLCRERLATGPVRALVANSGNANACVGPRGMDDAERMAAVTAEHLGLEETEVLVCSTGVIGVPMPMDSVESGIEKAVSALSPDRGGDASQAIMTTDTVEKSVALEFEVGGATVRIGGMAKGAGMIEPNMATMLAFLTTDAAVDPMALQACLSGAVAESFNRISVDGDQSCNDTVLLLANGMAGNTMLDTEHADWPLFNEAVLMATMSLALAIVKDGEGATKFVTVTVRGAASDDDAHRASRQIANSALVKTSWYGCDPNWGRVIDAVGHSGADVREELVDIMYDDLAAVRNGQKASDSTLKELEAVLAKAEFSVVVDLKLGQGTDTVYTCDLSEEYVRINSEYTT